MLRKFSSSRTHQDNLKLGALTAFSSGMINVSSLILFFAFTSHVTGHYSILAEEIAKGNYYQAAVVFIWIALFITGSFVSNLSVIHLGDVNTYVAHALPIALEIVVLVAVGTYGQYYYDETLVETEILVGMMLFAMGIQNGLTASVSNFAIKTTHLTGLSTDAGILFSMFTLEKFRRNQDLRKRAHLLFVIATFFLSGGILAGVLVINYQFQVFYYVSVLLFVLIFYDYTRTKIWLPIKNGINKRQNEAL